MLVVWRPEAMIPALGGLVAAVSVLVVTGSVPVVPRYVVLPSIRIEHVCCSHRIRLRSQCTLVPAIRIEHVCCSQRYRQCGRLSQWSLGGLGGLGGLGLCGLMAASVSVDFGFSGAFHVGGLASGGHDSSAWWFGGGGLGLSGHRFCAGGPAVCGTTIDSHRTRMLFA